MRCYMRRRASVSLLIAITLASLAWGHKHPINAWLVTPNHNLLCSWTTNVWPNVQTTTTRQSTNVKDAILVVWNVLMEDKSAPSAIWEPIFKETLVSNNAEQALSTKMRSHNCARIASHHVRHAACQPLCVIVAFKQFHRDSFTWTNVLLSVQPMLQ